MIDLEAAIDRFVVSHGEPGRRAAPAIDVPSSSTVRHISMAARTVSSPPGSTAADVSVHVAVAQSPSAHRQIRFDQHNTVSTR